MKQQLLIALLGLLLAGMTPATAEVVKFDDLTTPNTGNYPNWGVVPTNYAGFTWIGWEVLDTTTNYGPTLAPAPSMKNIAYNADGRLSVTTGGPVFDFVGAYFATFPSNLSPASTVTVQGFNSGNPVGSPTVVNLSATSFKWVAINASGVDEVRFTSSGDPKWFMMDNFTVPDGGTTLALLGGALMGLAALRRKFGV